jgi:two-component system chemotaxis response regulator CheB
VGVVLTGANDDGSRGLKRIADRGGLAFIQSPLTAESATMPEAAIRVVPGGRVLSIKEIADTLAALPMSPSRIATRAQAHR